MRPGRLLRVDLAARARELANTFSISGAISGDSHVVPGFALPRTLPINSGFWCGKPIAFPFLCFCDRPELSSARRHSCEGSGELGRLPPGVYPVGRPVCSLGPRGLRGAQADGDPGPFDRCLQLTDSVFKMIALSSRHTPHRTSHAAREPSVHADGLASASRPTSTERFILRDLRRSPRSVLFSATFVSGVPLTSRRFAGFPGGTQASTGVGPPDAAMASFGSNPRA